MAGDPSERCGSLATIGRPLADFLPDTTQTFEPWSAGAVGRFAPSVETTPETVTDTVAPDGSAYRLKNTNNDSADNVITTYTVNASSEVANGTWQLRVRDLYSADTGFIDSWRLTF